MSKSIKYDNFVFMTICGTTFELFKKTHFLTYRNYCQTLKMSLRDGKLSSKEMGDINHISDVLNNIYTMDSVTTGMYINDFFEKEKYLKFEKPVRYMLEFHPIAFTQC